SAYELGISKYTDGDKSRENGTIADNIQAGWRFVPPANVLKVPFDKGYYAEFKVAGFSEFWLNHGGLNNLSSLPVTLLKFTATKAGNDVSLKWTSAGESNVLRYEIEIARGNTALASNSFAKIGEAASAGNSAATKHYSYTDTEAPKMGVRYYRLKIVNADGSFSYSDVKAVMFDDILVWQVYPNPSAGKFNLVYQVNANAILLAAVYDVKGSLVKEYRTSATGFLQKLSIDISANNYASGMYLLRVNTGGQQQAFKLYKQ
ncbi:MAG TPA: T9SS type A sorting domain-containing protein, partial [Flavisolibacter sp.]|nr:T9SS type A sorting domain-containing protein [Flavisolibacter sp.]